MTAQDVMRGLAVLEKKYRRQFDRDRLDGVWRELLACDRAAFEKAVGRIKYSSKYIPEPEYLVLKAVEWMGRKPLISPVSKPDGDQGREGFDLLRRFMGGEIGEREYTAELYRLAVRWGRSCYAREAHERETAWEKKEAQESGMLFDPAG